MTVDSLNCFSHAQVKALATGQREAAYQRLADQLMGEAEPRLGRTTRCSGTFRSGNDQVRALRLVDSVEERIRIQISERLQQCEGEIAADDRRIGERCTALLAYALQPPADHKADSLRDVELAHLQ